MHIYIRRERTFEESRPLGIIPPYLCQYTLIQKKLPLIKCRAAETNQPGIFFTPRSAGHKADYKFINLSLFIFTAADHFFLSLRLYIILFGKCLQHFYFYFKKRVRIRSVAPVLREGRACSFSSISAGNTKGFELFINDGAWSRDASSSLGRTTRRELKRMVSTYLKKWGFWCARKTLLFLADAQRQARSSILMLHTVDSSFI